MTGACRALVITRRFAQSSIRETESGGGPCADRWHGVVRLLGSSWEGQRAQFAGGHVENWRVALQARPRSADRTPSPA